MANEMRIAGRKIGPEHPPLVIAAIGINHEGNYARALRMVDDAAAAGCECVEVQCHVARCALGAEEELALKRYVEQKGMLYLATPPSGAAADRLESMGVAGYKVGSGECNDYPLIRHIASFGKPILVSVAMDGIASIEPGVKILREAQVPYALMRCTSLRPTPYDEVRLGGLRELARAFPDAVLGLSDDSLGNYTCFAAVPLGASLLEKRFTSDKTWPGPDMRISIDPRELKDLVEGSRAIYQALTAKGT